MMFHIHKWSKWTELDYFVDDNSCIIPSRQQERECRKCGKIQIRDITDRKNNHDFRPITESEATKFNVPLTFVEEDNFCYEEFIRYQWCICDKCGTLARRRECSRVQND